MPDHPDTPPGYSDPGTFLRCPRVLLGQVEAGQVVVVGVPQDTTAASRPGARWGPRSIRSASCGFDYFLRSSLDAELVRVETGETLRYRDDLGLVDAGDLMTFPLDMPRTIQSVSGGTGEIVRRGALPIVLGGDHFIGFPACKGVVEGLRDRRPGWRVGYIHIDGHLDISDDNPTWGRYFHGTNARRISELEGIDYRNMVMFGITGVTRRDQWDFVRSHGIRMYTLGDVRRLGPEAAMEEAVSVASDGTDAVYVTCDIDVVDGAYAPGTGAVMFSGLTPAELLAAAGVLARLPTLAGVDVVEVAPNWDPMGRTPVLASSFITAILGPRLFTGTRLGRG